MKRLRKLARHFCVNLIILFSLLIHHIPFTHAMVIAPSAAEAFSVLLGLFATKAGSEQSTFHEWIKTDGAGSLKGNCILSLLENNLEHANTIANAHSIGQTMGQTLPADATLSFDQLARSTTQHSPSAQSIYAFLKSVRPAHAQEEPQVMPSPLSTQESTYSIPSSIPNSAALSDSFSAPYTDSPFIVIQECKPVFTSKEDIERANRRTYNMQEEAASKIKIEWEQQLQARNRKLEHGIVAGLSFIKMLGEKFRHAQQTVEQQRQEDKAFEQAINSNSFVKEAYTDAVNCTVDILLKAHSPYIDSTQQNHALLALNHIRLRGKAGRYLQQVIQTISYEHFDADGLLKAVHPNINYKHAVDMLLPLFQHIAHDQKEYHTYLHSLEQAFTSPHKKTALSKEIHTLIKQQRTKEFKQATDSEFKAVLYEMLPQVIKTMGKRDQSVIADNDLNKDFINVINLCLVDVTDPQQNPLGSFAGAERLISSCKNKRYQQSMRHFYETMHTKAMGTNETIPLAFKNDPHAYINPPTSLIERKQRIQHLAERYQLKKKLEHALGIPNPKDETVDKLLYTLITPESKQLYVTPTPETLPSADKMVDHLLTCKNHHYKPLSDAAFNQFFTSQGIFKSLQPKLKDYPELTKAQLLVHPNKELLRHANYFLALDTTDKNKHQIQQGLSYICAAASTTGDSAGYMSLARAQYKALIDATADKTILDYPLTPQTYKNTQQKAAHHDALELAVEALNALEQEQKASGRYALRAASIAQTLNAAGKPEDAANIAHNVSQILKAPNHATGSFEFLCNTIDAVHTLPGAFDANSLLGITLRRDLNACKPDLIKKSGRAAKEYAKILKNSKADLQPGTQQTVHSKLVHITNVAEKVLKQASTHPSSQGTAAALHADLLVRLTHQAHTLNGEDKSQEALDLLQKFEPTLVLECEAYLNNPHNKPPQGIPCTTPTTIAPPKSKCAEGSKDSEQLPQVSSTSKADNLEKEKAQRQGTGTAIKEPKPKTSCNSATQSLPGIQKEPLIIIATPPVLNQDGKPVAADQPPLVDPERKPLRSETCPTVVNSDDKPIDSATYKPTIVDPKGNPIDSKTCPTFRDLNGKPIDSSTYKPPLVRPKDSSPESAQNEPVPLQPEQDPAVETEQEQSPLIKVPLEVVVKKHHLNLLKWVAENNCSIKDDPLLYEESGGRKRLSEDRYQQMIKDVCLQYRDPALAYWFIHELIEANKILKSQCYYFPGKEGILEPCSVSITNCYHSFTMQIKNKSHVSGGHSDHANILEKLMKEDLEYTIRKQRVGDELLGCYQAYLTLAHELLTAEQLANMKPKDMFPDANSPTQNALLVQEAANNFLVDKTMPSTKHDGEVIVFGQASNGTIIRFVLSKPSKNGFRGTKTFHPSYYWMQKER
jgi:hypothetical protein